MIDVLEARLMAVEATAAKLVEADVWELVA